MLTHTTSKGQVVIPASLRKKYGITTGTRLSVSDDGECIILKPISPDYVRSLRGLLDGKGALDELRQDRKRERDR